MSGTHLSAVCAKVTAECVADAVVRACGEIVGDDDPACIDPDVMDALADLLIAAKRFKRETSRWAESTAPGAAMEARAS